MRSARRHQGHRRPGRAGRKGPGSGGTAISGASSALKNSWAMHHPARTTAMLGANATMRMPREPPARPMTMHGRRMPSCDEVRSLILPKNGLPTMASRAPIPATSAKLSGACLIPASELTFNAKVTSRGARNTREVLMYARVYSEMKPHPARRAAGDSGSSAASAALRYFNPSSPAVAGRRGRTAGGCPRDRERRALRSPQGGTEPGDQREAQTRVTCAGVNRIRVASLAGGTTFAGVLMWRARN